MVDAFCVLHLDRLELAHERREGQVDLALVVIVVAQQRLHATLGEHAHPPVATVAEVHRRHARRPQRAPRGCSAVGAATLRQGGRHDGEALTNHLTDPRSREVLFDVLSSEPSTCPSQLAILVDLAHVCRALVDRWLGPDLTSAVRAHVLGQLDQLVADQEAVRRRHEVGIARIASGDTGLPLAIASAMSSPSPSER